MMDCPCTVDPVGSTCGNWEGNESLCGCADLGVIIKWGGPAPP